MNTFLVFNVILLWSPVHTSKEGEATFDLPQKERKKSPFMIGGNESKTSFES
jgi:hypothetical protein